MVMNDNSWKTAQDYIMNDIMNDIVNDKKGHNIVNGSFAHIVRKPTCDRMPKGDQVSDNNQIQGTYLEKCILLPSRISGTKPLQ